MEVACATALINLAAELPSAVLADLLGIHLSTAVSWARHAGNDWTAYIEARTAATTSDPAQLSSASQRRRRSVQ